MPKFSIIIPVYNVEEYIERCLDSVFNQSFKDFEVILVDDGCTDKSIEKAKKYDLTIIKSAHEGVSEARNIGVKKAHGQYLLFLDSDDYWEKDLLKELDKSTENNPDVIRFQIQTVNDNKEITKYEEETFENSPGKKAFEKIVKFHFIDSCWCYAYKMSYYKKEKFAFKKGTVHEDFGLVPLIILKAKKVNSIKYIGYDYYRRSGSIMNNKNYDWTKRKVDDMYYHYNNLLEESKKIKGDLKIFKSYIANCMILKITELNNKDYRIYLKKLKNNKVFDNLLTDTLSRKVKRVLLKISPKIYYKLIKR